MKKIDLENLFWGLLKDSSFKNGLKNISVND